MQQTRVVEKRKLYWDGEEIPGLVSMPELNLEMGEVEVPEFDKIITVANGVVKVNPFTLVYKLARDGKAMKFLNDFFTEGETHDLTIARTDGAGVEFGRILIQDCECSKKTYPPYDAASPEFAKLTVNILPGSVPVDLPPE
jgi:hypothetical protein